jgi:hypothetical protein
MKKLLFITTFFFSLIISAQNEDKQISNVFNNGTIYKDGSDDCTDPANYEIPGQWVVYANYCLNQFRFWNGVSWSEWGNSGGGGSANNYVDSASFDDLTGNLRLTRLGLSPITTNLDGRYLISESQTATDVPFTPYLTITSANLQLAFQELKDEIDAIDLSVIATNVSITDTGDYFTSNNIEGALQELGLDVSNLIAGGSDGNDYVTSGTVIADTLRLTITNQPDVDILVPTLLENTQLTPEQVQDIIGSFIVDGTNTIVNYNDVANTLQINSNQSLPANQIGYGNGSTIVGNAGFSYDPSNFTITSVGNAITGTLTMSPLEIKGEGGIGQNSMRFWRDGIIWTAASSSPIIGIANTVTDPLGSLGYKVLNFDVVEGEHNIYVPARNGAITMALTDGNTTLDTPITGVLDISPLLNGLGDVTSVNTQTGDVVLDADDIDDTSTTNKFATAQQLANIAINESDITALQSGKQDNLTITTNGTSGAATLVGSTLNIPDYVSSSVYNPYFLSNASDFESAIDSVKTKTLNEGKQYFLILDQDVIITGSPREITVDVPVIVQKGMVITTPEVTLPITGTINENYIRLQFNETFIADKDSQVFNGDGLIWFGFNSIDKLYAKWYGLVYDSQLEVDQNQNVDALIRAGITVSQDRSDRATTTIHIGSGDLYLNSPVPFFATSDLNDHPHLTGVRRSATVTATVINVEGATPIKHGYRVGEQTKIIYTAKYGAPFMPQGMRNSSFRNLQFLGQNDFDSDTSWQPAGYPFQPNYSELVLRNDNFEGGDVNEIHWIEDDINWGRGRPYSAIITDAFRTGVGGGAYSLANEPTSKIDLYYTESVTPNDQNSWDVIVENIHAKYFVEFMTVGLKGQQNDTYVWRNIQVEKMPIGISIVQDQSRDCKVYEFMSYLDCWTMFDTTIHGSGIMPEVMSAHTAGGLKYIMHGFQSDGIVNLSNIYAEALYGIGTNFYNDDVFTLNGLPETDELPNRVLFPASINNSTFKLLSNDTFTYDGGTGYWPRPPTLKGVRINNSLIGVYTFGDEPNFRYQTFEDVELNGVALGTTLNQIQPVDAGYFKTSLRTTISDASNWKTVDWAHTSTYTANDISENNVGQYIPDALSDLANIPLKYNKGTLVDRVLLDRCDITGYDRLKASFTISNFDGQLSVGDFVRLNRSNFNIQGTVRLDNGDGSYLIASLNTADLDLLDAQTTSGESLNYFDVYLVRHRDSDKPWLATKGANNKELVLEKYAQYGSSPFFDGQNIEVYDKFVFSDGIKRTVTEVNGNTIVFKEDYTPNDTTWVKPLRPNIKTINFIEPNTTSFNYSGFFEEGQTYNYYLRQYSPILISNVNLKTPYTALCVKTGDFSGNIKGSIESDNKASFLIIDEKGEILSYLDGASYNTTDGVDNKILLNRSGATAERPDNNGFPVEYLPNSFTYNNTETGFSEIWNGSAFVSIGGGSTVDNTILTTSLTTDRTLAVSDINDFNIFTIDAAGLTLTIPQTTLATGEIKFITFLAPNEASFTVAGDTGVTVPSPSTFSGLRVVTLYSTTEDVWLLYNSEEDAGGGISGVETQDEGVQVDADATTLNFVGAGVSATDAGNGVTTVTISGGGGGGFNQTTFNGQDVHFIKHPDNVGSEFEDYDFITNYVENDTIYQLAQYRGGGQSAANLDGIEKVFIGSSRFDIPVLDLILNGTFDDSSNLTVGANWTIGGGVATFDDVTNSELDFALSSNLLPNTEYIFKTTANSPTSDQVRWQLAGLESASETEIVVYDFYDEGTVFNRFTTGLGTDYDTLRLRASSSAPAPFTIDDVILQEDSYDKGILTNGTFDDATGLTLDASLTVSGGKLQFDDTTFGYAIFDLDTPMVAGKTYRLRVDVEYGTASFSRIRLYGTNDGTTSNMFNLFGLENREPEKLDFVFTAPVETSVNTQLIIYFSDGTNGTLSIDNVGLTELTP